MNAIRSVAGAVFRESVRDRVFYNLVLFAVLLVTASILIGQLTAGQDVKIIKDLGLAATSLFGLFIAIFVGINLVSKEVDRRSVYPLFAKPVRRGEFILGKYAGLLLTLLANITVMTIAIYAVLYFLSRDVPPNIQAAWDAPAMDPALLKAIALIYCNLAVVTAVALFFSTYSSPMLSAVFTIGVYIAGQFNADLKRFDLIVDSPAAVAVAQGAVLRPAGLREVRRQACGGSRHARQRRLPGLDRRLRRAVRRRAALRRDDDFLEERLQVTRGVAAAAAAACLGGAVALHAAQDRWPAPQVDAPGLLYLRSSATVTTHRPRLRRDRRGPVLDPRPAAFRRRAPLAAGTSAHLRAPVPAPRSLDDPGSVLQHRLPLRRDLPGGSVSRRPGPSRPRHCALEERAGRPAGQVAVHDGPGLHLLLAPPRLRVGQRRVSARVGDAGCAGVAAAARRGDPGGRRASRGVADPVAAARAGRRAVAA